MSAFMCSDLHLSVLAIYAVRHKLVRLTDPRLDHDPLGREKAAFRMFRRENAASVDHRYPGSLESSQAANEQAEGGELVERARPLLRTLGPVSLIKQCHCYAYQASEHPGWERSEAKNTIESIEAHAVRALPGYEAAPWGLDR